MDPPQGCPRWLTVSTAAERPDLWEQAQREDLFHDLWPEYNHHGVHTATYFGALFPRFADFQALFVDERSSRLVARGRTIPFRWDGSLKDLPEGIDALGLRAVEENVEPTALCALAAEVAKTAQGSGMSSLVVATMIGLASAHRLRPLAAPVRPSQKHRYPLTPIDRYVQWRRSDGLPFDPWVRVHVRRGARILRTAPDSMHIVAPVEDWEAWTGMSFPEEGDYVFPGGLAPLRVSGGQADYWEPNVWVAHDVMPR
jgi:hypothetical protein